MAALPLEFFFEVTYFGNFWVYDGAWRVISLTMFVFLVADLSCGIDVSATETKESVWTSVGADKPLEVLREWGLRLKTLTYCSVEFSAVCVNNLLGNFEGTSVKIPSIAYDYGDPYWS